MKEDLKRFYRLEGEEENGGAASSDKRHDHDTSEPEDDEDEDEEEEEEEEEDGADESGSDGDDDSGSHLSDIEDVDFKFAEFCFRWRERSICATILLLSYFHDWLQRY